MKSIFFTIVVLLTGCLLKQNVDIQGKEYRMIDAPNGAEITLGFDAKEPRFFGKSAVNRYFGGYKLSGNKIEFSPAGSTMMMGSPTFMKAEQDYLKALPLIKKVKLKGKDLFLILESGRTKYRFQETLPKVVEAK